MSDLKSHWEDCERNKLLNDVMLVLDKALNNEDSKENLKEQLDKIYDTYYKNIFAIKVHGDMFQNLHNFLKNGGD